MFISKTMAIDPVQLVPHEKLLELAMKDPAYRKAHRLQQPPFSISNQLYKRRKELGLELGDICALSGMPSPRVRKADSGEETDLEILACIAEVMGCHIQIILVSNESVSKEKGGEG